MSQQVIKIAVLGCGARSSYVVGNLLKEAGDAVKIVAVYEPDPAVATETLRKWKAEDAVQCKTYQEAIETEGVQWVMVFSPNAHHKEQVVHAFSCGRHVFSEKPLATSLEDCVAINDAHRRSGCQFATGFVLRYSLLYQKAKEILSSGILGKIILVEGNENITPVHGGYIMCNWRRHSSEAGPHILEKCCHDLDLIEFLVASIPEKIMAFGGRNFFIPENGKLLEKYGEKAFMTWPDPHRTATPFTDDSDMMDNLVSIAEFKNQVRVSFSYTMSNAIPERRLYFSCSEGNLRLDLYAKKISWRNIGDAAEHTLEFTGSDGHGGGDDTIMKELFDTMVNHTPPRCAGKEGLRSAVYAMAIDKAATTGAIVNLAPVWKELGEE